MKFNPVSVDAEWIFPARGEVSDRRSFNATRSYSLFMKLCTLAFFSSWTRNVGREYQHTERIDLQQNQLEMKKII